MERKTKSIYRKNHSIPKENKNTNNEVASPAFRRYASVSSQYFL